MVANQQITPHQVCDNLLIQVKNSQLNFHLSETPYSINLSIRKRFLKEANSLLDLVTYAFENSDKDNASSNSENEKLKKVIEEKEVENKAFKETVAILESKVENAEAELVRHFKESKNLRKSYEKEKE